MDLASACPLCGRAVGNTGYLVVERAYWYHDCSAQPASQTGAPALAHAAGPALPAAGQSMLVDSAFQPRLRLTISPVRDSGAIQQFGAALVRSPAVRGLELEQYVGQVAVLAVDATSVSELVAALLSVEGFPVSGLTITADGQLSARLDVQTADTMPPPYATPAPAIPPFTPPFASPLPPAPTVPTTFAASRIEPGKLSDLRSRVQRLSQDLSQMLAGSAPPPTSQGFAYPPQQASPAPAPLSTDEPPHPSAVENAERHAPSPAESGEHDVAASADAPHDPFTRPPGSDPSHAPDFESLLPAHASTLWEGYDRGNSNGHSAYEPSAGPFGVAVQEPPTGEIAAEEQRALRDTPEAAPDTHPPTPGEDAETWDVAAFGAAAVEDRVDAQPDAAGAGAAQLRAEPALPAQRRAPDTAQSMQVVAYPFENFSGVNSFINAVRLLPDVRYVAPRRFRAGTIQLTVDYAGDEPLGERLRTLAGFSARVVSESSDTVTVTIGGD